MLLKDVIQLDFLLGFLLNVMIAYNKSYAKSCHAINIPQSMIHGFLKFLFHVFKE